MPRRFVLLFHKTTPEFETEHRRGDHFDLMIESPDRSCLWSWAFEQNPFELIEANATANNGSPIQIPARRVQDHRVAYLDYEGEVSENRGAVSKVATGSARWIEVTGSKLAARKFFGHPHEGCAIVELNSDTLILLSEASSTWLLGRG